MNRILLLLLSLLASSASLAGEIALSFDDAPTPDSGVQTGEQRTEALLAQLKAAKAPPALFFVTTKHLNADSQKRLALYAQAGHYIANHSHAHISANEASVEDVLRDAQQAHGELKDLPAFVPLYRFPFLHEGQDRAAREALRQGLAQLGYRNGYVTVDNFDWYLNSLYEQAVKSGKRVDMERLRELYVATLWEGIQFYDDVARETLGRSPKHVLLLHENDLAAAFVGDLIRHIRSQGWQVIDPLEAYEDAIAHSKGDLTFTKQGRVAALAHAKGVKPDALRHKSENTEYLDELFQHSQIITP